MCPQGRSTDIIRQLGPQMYEIASGGKLSEESLRVLAEFALVDGELRL